MEAEALILEYLYYCLLTIIPVIVSLWYIPSIFLSFCVTVLYSFLKDHYQFTLTNEYSTS